MLGELSQEDRERLAKKYEESHINSQSKFGIALRKVVGELKELIKADLEEKGVKQ